MDRAGRLSTPELENKGDKDIEICLKAHSMTAGHRAVGADGPMHRSDSSRSENRWPDGRVLLLLVGQSICRS